jgi:hypothetical protein
LLWIPKKEGERLEKEEGVDRGEKALVDRVDFKMFLCSKREIVGRLDRRREIRAPLLFRDSLSISLLAKEGEEREERVEAILKRDSLAISLLEIEMALLGERGEEKQGVHREADSVEREEVERKRVSKSFLSIRFWRRLERVDCWVVSNLPTESAPGEREIKRERKGK